MEILRKQKKIIIGILLIFGVAGGAGWITISHLLGQQASNIAVFNKQVTRAPSATVTSPLVPVGAEYLGDGFNSSVYRDGDLVYKVIRGGSESTGHLVNYVNQISEAFPLVPSLNRIGDNVVTQRYIEGLEYTSLTYTAKQNAKVRAWEFTRQVLDRFGTSWFGEQMVPLRSYSIPISTNNARIGVDMSLPNFRFLPNGTIVGMFDPLVLHDKFTDAEEFIRGVQARELSLLAEVAQKGIDVNNPSALANYILQDPNRYNIVLADMDNLQHYLRVNGVIAQAIHEKGVPIGVKISGVDPQITTNLNQAMRGAIYNSSIPVARGIEFRWGPSPGKGTTQNLYPAAPPGNVQVNNSRLSIDRLLEADKNSVSGAVQLGVRSAFAQEAVAANSSVQKLLPTSTVTPPTRSPGLKYLSSAEGQAFFSKSANALGVASMLSTAVAGIGNASEALSKAQTDDERNQIINNAAIATNTGVLGAVFFPIAFNATKKLVVVVSTTLLGTSSAPLAGGAFVVAVLGVSLAELMDPNTARGIASVLANPSDAGRVVEQILQYDLKNMSTILNYVGHTRNLIIDTLTSLKLLTTTSYNDLINRIATQYTLNRCKKDNFFYLTFGFFPPAFPAMPPLTTPETTCFYTKNKDVRWSSGPYNRSGFPSNCFGFGSDPIEAVKARANCGDAPIWSGPNGDNYSSWDFMVVTETNGVAVVSYKWRDKAWGNCDTCFSVSTVSASEVAPNFCETSTCVNSPSSNPAIKDFVCKMNEIETTNYGKIYQRDIMDADCASDLCSSFQSKDNSQIYRCPFGSEKIGTSESKCQRLATPTCR